MKLFSEYKLGKMVLRNRMVMSPMTRCRANGNVPNELMLTYYRQRAEAGLIITEGTAPSPNGLGYARIPGIFSREQLEGWKEITSAVHEEGGRIFLQIMHTGRVSHPDNMSEGSRILSPSAVKLEGQMYTDSKGLQDYPVPEPMSTGDIEKSIDEYGMAAENAVKAGFDGIELHGANGYLIDQFINTATNKRADEYGGDYKNRLRYVIEVVNEVAKRIGPDRVGLRLSPYGVFNGMEIFEGQEECFGYLAAELKKLGIVYLHLVDHSSMGAPEVPEAIKTRIKDEFGGNIILSGGLTKDQAETLLQEDEGDLAAFGRPFLANPDLLLRFRNNLELNDPDYDRFYTPGEEGYIDYPFAKS